MAEIKRLPCPLCPRRFWTVRQLENHLRKKHGAK